MSEARIDDLSIDNKLDTVLSDLDALHAKVDSLIELVEDITERFNDLAYGGDGFSIDE